MPKPPLLGKTPPAGGGGTQVPKGDSGIERSEDDGEVVQSSTCVIPLTLKASFVQPLSLASARQLSWQESPWQGGFVLLRLIEVCWKTSRNAKASHFGRGVCGADGEGKDAAKEPDTQRYAPCLSEPSYRNAAGVISPGLPSQALTRQLPQSGSPWQRGVALRQPNHLTRNSLNKNQHRKLTGGGLYHLATCSAADSRLPDQRGGGAVPPHGGRLLRLCAVG